MTATTALSTPKGNVFSGARARLTVDGVVIGYATGVSAQEVVDYEPIKVLDAIYTVEWVPTSYDVSMTFSRIRLIGDTLKGGKTLSIFPQVGKNGEDLLKNVLALAQRELTAQIEDPTTGTMMAIATGIVIPRHSWSISSRGIVGEDIEVLARLLYEEADSQ